MKQNSPHVRVGISAAVDSPCHAARWINIWLIASYLPWWATVVAGMACWWTIGTTTRLPHNPPITCSYWLESVCHVSGVIISLHCRVLLAGVAGHAHTQHDKCEHKHVCAVKCKRCYMQWVICFILSHKDKKKCWHVWVYFDQSLVCKVASEKIKKERKLLTSGFLSHFCHSFSWQLSSWACFRGLHRKASLDDCNLPWQLHGWYLHVALDIIIIIIIILLSLLLLSLFLLILLSPLSLLLLVITIQV